MPSDERAGARAAPRADRNAVVPCPIDEVRDDQKVAGEAHLHDGADLEREPFAVAYGLALAVRRLRKQLFEAPRQPGFGLLPR